MGDSRFTIENTLGATRENNKIRFSFVSEAEDCGIILYDRNTKSEVKRIPFLPEERIGNIYSKVVSGLAMEELAYQFYEKDNLLADNYGKAFLAAHAYGEITKEEELLAILPTDNFTWKKDKNPKLSYADSLCYCMHVRGFTKHTSSKVKHRGTFDGVREKIPYLLESGITTIELQPIYEFLEMTPEKESYMAFKEPKLNYWGYTKGFYYAPKAAYAASVDGVTELKTLISELHKNGMELVLQFYFPREIRRNEILSILKYWVLEYHVDGFHLLGENLPLSMLAQEPLLADTKLWCDGFDEDFLWQNREAQQNKYLANYQNDYRTTMRCFLKGDEGMLEQAISQMRKIPCGMGRIHFLSNYEGLTLYDMVSYDHKHNEENGEDNKDGCQRDYSWNCGEEGESRKPRIKQLRLQQMKNALCFLFFSQSTPLLFMGDEFGNSQKGNNNPYCQDNETTWLNWNNLKKNNELYDFFQMLTRLRRQNSILHLEKEARLMDYAACGYPDISYHGERAWQPGVFDYQRHIGILFCGQYGEVQNQEQSFLYMGINMHWEAHRLALPKLPKDMRWELLFTTKPAEISFLEEESLQNQVCRIEPRSVFILIGTKTV